MTDSQFRPRLSKKEYHLIKRYRGEDANNREKSAVVLGCVHVPFHNRELIDKVIKLIRDTKPDEIILNGDFVDCNALSDYERGKVSKTNVTLEEEYEEANKVLDRMEKASPNSKIVYLFGNHEERYFRWKADVNNSKYGDMLNPVKALGLEERGAKVITDYKKGYHMFGDLEIMHGEYHNIHVAKKHLETFHSNVLFAHTHRVQTYREGKTCAYNMGWLGDKNAPAFSYAPRGMMSKWAEAFAFLNMDSYGKTHVNMIECANNSFYFGGMKY